MLYCYIKNNAIGSPTSLPRNWDNISNFYLLAPEILATYGWYPCYTSEKPAYDDRTQKLTEALTLGDAEVFQTWHVTDLNPEEQIAFATARINEIGDRISGFLDQQVAVKKYDTILSATSWNLSNITLYKDEGAQAAAYRDMVWTQFDNLVAGVQAGTTPLPTVDDWFASLPPLWPQPAPPDNGNLPSNGTI